MGLSVSSQRANVEPASVRPVVKWAGGKRRLSSALLRWMPKRMGTYAEPFCGGAAVFFALAAEKKRRFSHAILADKNEELVALYRAIRDDVDVLTDRLRAYQSDHMARDPNARREHYYEVRSVTTANLDDVERGARLLFLNKTCFNGLWRVNASGKFNVPFGRYKAPKILDERRLRAAHEALADVDIRLADFGDVSSELVAGDFAYFDPPYVPVSKTANFTAYSSSFGRTEQERLANELVRLRQRRVNAMLSNAYCAETLELYAKFRHKKKIPVARAINSDPAKRGDVDEIVVMNYSPKVRA